MNMDMDVDMDMDHNSDINNININLNHARMDKKPPATAFEEAMEVQDQCYTTVMPTSTADNTCMNPMTPTISGASRRHLQRFHQAPSN
jgi:hypothetical protein